MKDKRYIKSRIFIKILKILPVVFIAVMTALTVYLFAFSGIPYEEILNYRPSNYFAAIFVIALFYAVKSLSVVFPVIIIYAFVGNMFPIWAALLINFAGLSITMTVPYFAGRLSAAEYIEKFTRRYDKKGKIDKITKENQFFASYILRVVGFLPADIVSMILGSMRFNLKKYFTGSMLGATPSMIIITLLGSTVSDPTSPSFLISIIVTVFFSGMSLIIHQVLKNKYK